MVGGATTEPAMPVVVVGIGDAAIPTSSKEVGRPRDRVRSLRSAARAAVKAGAFRAARRAIRMADAPARRRENDAPLRTTMHRVFGRRFAEVPAREGHAGIDRIMTLCRILAHGRAGGAVGALALDVRASGSARLVPGDEVVSRKAPAARCCARGAGARRVRRTRAGARVRGERVVVRRLSATRDHQCREHRQAVGSGSHRHPD